ncbi:MAG: hypothetical protein AABY13_06095 [Nanoarchaeota archaeon]
MYASLIVFLVSLVFFAVLGALVLKDIVVALLNGVILYLLLYRAYFDLMKGRFKPYLIGLAIGITAVLLLPSLPQLWDITMVVIVTFVVVEALRVYHKKK